MEKDEIHDDMPEEIKDFKLTASLFCMRSKFLQFTCVVAPTIALLIILLASSAPAEYLALACLPCGLYMLGWIRLTCYITKLQNKRDEKNATVAQQHLKRRAVAKKYSVAPAKAASNDHGQLYAMFLHAAKVTNLEYLNWSINEGQHPDERDQLGRTALHWACCFGNDVIVSALLKAGCTVDLQDKIDKLTPLHYAAFYGHMKVVRLLVDAGANLKAESSTKLNPLQMAEIASLRTSTVQPAHRMIVKYLRTAMGTEASEPMEHVCGLTVLRYLEKQLQES